MELNVITPTNKIFDGKVVSISLPGQAGTFQVLNNHTPIISSLKTGEIVVELSEKFEESGSNAMIKQIDANHISISINSGVVELIDNKLIVLAE
jgi:F-type H+-transporting ATPase subunit epsilon